MISGTSYRGTFEERMTGVIAEAEAEADAAAGKVVLFVDEIHMLLGAGRVSGGCIDASNMLKPALARGRVRCLGATTHDEYHRYMVRDAAFERRFQKVHVAEPSVDDTVAILRRLKPSYQDHHAWISRTPPSSPPPSSPVATSQVRDHCVALDHQSTLLTMCASQRGTSRTRRSTWSTRRARRRGC
ncbi:Os02g0297067 [Oryza sativa Japonica Group]|uniref:Os02g0297067 protein n=1 Tax=Oryza sativa subsp. japonica TaxID=39947 RepID=A0A0P0VHW8_ORYSJ|nr:Os02g0297067 [Oryza sativa Japonica Group]